MNSKYLVVILLLFILTSTSSYAFVSNSTQEIEATEVISDSLQIDDSNIQPKEFDDFKEKYSEDDFIYERNAENSGWWSRFKQWLKDLFKSWFDIQNSEEASDLTDFMVKLAGVIVFLLVAFFIFKAVMNDEGQWVFGRSSDKSVIPVTDVEGHLDIVDFDKLTQEAETNEEFRLAIRYYYLWLLKGLSQAEIIAYDNEKTNSDYVNEIQSENIRKEFAYTSYLYNYIWYGEFDVSDQDFHKAKHAFVKFIKSIPISA